MTDPYRLLAEEIVRDGADGLCQRIADALHQVDRRARHDCSEIMSSALSAIVGTIKARA